MDDHVPFSGTKYEKGNKTSNGNHCKCGENCSKIRGHTPSPPRLGVTSIHDLSPQSSIATVYHGASVGFFVLCNRHWFNRVQ
jgi:hypothetical protein